ncbi:outer membrane protein assembly factor BamB family protein [Natrialbaceae archaeon A-gly3]
MNRRSFLRSAAGVSVVTAVAGCLSALDPSSSSPSAIDDRDATAYEDGTEAWPGYGFDSQNTWHNPDVSLFSDPPSASRITRSGPGIETTPDSAVAVAGNRLYFGTADGLVVSYATTGELLWEYTANRRIGVTTTPLLARELTFVTTGNGTAALTADSGGRLWGSDAFVQSGSSVLTDDRLYATTEGTLVVALEVETGDTAWTLTEDDLADEGELEDTRPTVDAVGVADGVVYATGSWKGAGTVLAAEDGEPLWWRDEFDAIRRPPAIGEDVVVITTRTGVFALDRTDGHTVWDFPFPSGWSVAQGLTPAIAHGHVYVTGGETTCLDLETGEKLWAHETGGRREPPVAVADGLYVGTLEGLYAIEPDGTLAWHDEGIRTERPVTAVGNRLYAVVSAGELGSDDVYELTD